MHRLSPSLRSFSRRKITINIEQNSSEVHYKRERYLCKSSGGTQYTGQTLSVVNLQLYVVIFLFYSSCIK